MCFSPDRLSNIFLLHEIDHLLFSNSIESKYFTVDRGKFFFETTKEVSNKFAKNFVMHFHVKVRVPPNVLQDEQQEFL